MRKLATLAIVTTIALGGCTWVKLDQGGKHVQIGYAGDVNNCQKVGVVSARTQDQVILERNESKVQKELYTLARNDAAKMGATNLVQHALPKDGRQAFTAYRCDPV